MELLKKVNDIQLSDYTKFLVKEATDKYEKYLEQILSLDANSLRHYLKTIKRAEIVNNQTAEAENDLLISYYADRQRKDSLSKLIEIYRENNELTREDILKLHKILMKGTESDNQNYKFRQDDNKFVGSFDQYGQKRIDYMPINHTEIEVSIEKTLEFLNNQEIDNVFINPFIVHGLIAVMQPFDDGNTRLSRLVQHGKIWKNTNHLYGTNLDFPCIYLSKNYLISRGQYRQLITDLAVQQDNEAWNRWFKYNLYKVDEQLNYLESAVQKIKK